MPSSFPPAFRDVPAPPAGVHGLLREAGRAAREGKLDDALSLVEAADRRSAPQRALRLLRARLLLRLGQPQEAEALLTTLPSDAAVDTLRLEALGELGRLHDAALLARTLLASFAVDAVPGLASILDRLTLKAAWPGWVGTHSSLQRIARRWVPSAPFGHPGLPANGPAGHWQEDPIAPGEPGPAGEAPLLGADLPCPPDFRPSGWVLCQGMQLEGAGQLAWRPGAPCTIALLAAGQELQRIPVAPALEDPGAPHPFRVTLDAALAGLLLEVVIVCPDGSRAPLVGSPIQPSPSHDTPKPRLIALTRTSRRRPATPHKIDIVVPVHSGRAETLRCLHSVINTVPSTDADCIVIDDASPEPELSAALDQLAAEGRIQLLRNPANLGFPASVNRGLALHPERDVVILNADCTVFGDWLARLHRAAYARPDIGTVTPLGPDCTIVSYPADGAPAPAGDRIERAQALAALASACSEPAVELPVGVGFCMYLRRDCIEQAGLFDAASFGRGYGEENDFCLRASQLGWRHVCSPDVYVDHVGGRSFGASKALWMARNSRLLDTRYPDYQDAVARHLAQDPLHPARRAIDLARLQARATRSPGDCVLLLSLGLPGGVRRHVDETMAAARSRGDLCLLLRPVDAVPGRVRIDLPDEDALQDLYFDWESEGTVLHEALSALGITRIELHHFLGLPAALVDAVLSLAAPVRVLLHDHAWICPRLTLTGGDDRYCGEPAVNDCERCIARHGSELEAGLGVAALRARSQGWLARAQAVIAPTHDVAQRYRRYFPGVAITVQGWEAPVVRPPLQHLPLTGRVRVALIGALSAQKGYHVLRRCAEEARRLALPIEFILVGYSEDDARLRASGAISITGPYQESELDALLDRAACHVAWFASVTPETWCYALTTALRRDMPIVAFDLGAQAERLVGVPGCTLLPLDAPSARILATLQEAAGRVDDALMRVAPARPADAHATTPSLMDPTPTPHPHESASPAQTATVHPLVLPEGVYAAQIAAGPVPDEQASGPGDLRLPALSIGPAPAPQLGQVDLFPGPGTVDRWLCHPDDHVTVRITGGEATLLVTSVRARGKPALSILIRRLDQAQADPRPGLQVRLMVHVQWLGDLFIAQGPAGPFGRGLAVEAIVVEGDDGAGNSLIEYRARTADGFETPWLSDGMLAGSRGRGIPLTAVAVRPRIAFAAEYRVRLRACFRSGGWQEAAAEGGWLASPHRDDPIDGLEVEWLPRGILR